MRVSQIICEQEQPLTSAEIKELEELRQRILRDNPDAEKDTALGPAFRALDNLLGREGPQPPAKDKRGMTSTSRSAAIEFNKSLSSKQILWAQNALRRAGIPVVGRDGVNDETFINAIYDFQLKSSIPPTGKYDMRTIDALKFVMKQATGSETGDDTITQRPGDGKGGSVVISDFGNTPKEFAALPGKQINVPEKGAVIKIIDQKPYENDPNTTVVLYALKSAEDNVRFGITGINTKNRTEFILDRDDENASRNSNKMKEIYAKDALRLKGPYTFYNGTVPAALADALTSSAK